MMRHLKIFIHFARYCWMGEMEFRVNFFMWMVVNIIWGAFSLIFVNIVFSQVNTIAGWSKPEAMILAATHVLFAGLLWIIILPNVSHFHELIRKGEFDFALLKPLNLRFYVSTKIVEFDQLPRLLITPFIFGYLLQFLHYTPGIFSILVFVLLVILGLVIFYNLFFMMMTTNIWLVNTFNLENLFESLTDVGRFPVQVFSGSLKLLFFYLIPVGYIATFPTQALLGQGNYLMIITAIFMAIISFVLSQLLWRFALRHYSSASS